MAKLIPMMALVAVLATLSAPVPAKAGVGVFVQVGVPGFGAVVASPPLVYPEPVVVYQPVYVPGVVYSRPVYRPIVYRQHPGHFHQFKQPKFKYRGHGCR